MDVARERALAYVKAVPSRDRVMLVRVDALATPATAFEPEPQKTGAGHLCIAAKCHGADTQAFHLLLNCESVDDASCLCSLGGAGRGEASALTMLSEAGTSVVDMSTLVISARARRASSRVTARAWMLTPRQQGRSMSGDPGHDRVEVMQRFSFRRGRPSQDHDFDSSARAALILA